jgi:hypothetical protein
MQDLIADQQQQQQGQNLLLDTADMDAVASQLTLPDPAPPAAPPPIAVPPPVQSPGPAAAEHAKSPLAATHAHISADLAPLNQIYAQCIKKDALFPISSPGRSNKVPVRAQFVMPADPAAVLAARAKVLPAATAASPATTTAPSPSPVASPAPPALPVDGHVQLPLPVPAKPAATAATTTVSDPVQEGKKQMEAVVVPPDVSTVAVFNKPIKPQPERPPKAPAESAVPKNVPKPGGAILPKNNDASTVPKNTAVPTDAGADKKRKKAEKKAARLKKKEEKWEKYDRDYGKATGGDAAESEAEEDNEVVEREEASSEDMHGEDLQQMPELTDEMVRKQKASELKPGEVDEYSASGIDDEGADSKDSEASAVEGSSSSDSDDKRKKKRHKKHHKKDKKKKHHHSKKEKKHRLKKASSPPPSTKKKGRIIQDEDGAAAATAAPLPEVAEPMEAAAATPPPAPGSPSPFEEKPPSPLPAPVETKPLVKKERPPVPQPVNLRRPASPVRDAPAASGAQKKAAAPQAPKPLLILDDNSNGLPGLEKKPSIYSGVAIPGYPVDASGLPMSEDNIPIYLQQVIKGLMLKQVCEMGDIAVDNSLLYFNSQPKLYSALRCCELVQQSKLPPGAELSCASIVHTFFVMQQHIAKPIPTLFPLRNAVKLVLDHKVIKPLQRLTQYQHYADTLRTHALDSGRVNIVEISELPHQDDTSDESRPVKVDLWNELDSLHQPSTYEMPADLAEVLSMCINLLQPQWQVRQLLEQCARKHLACPPGDDVKRRIKNLVRGDVNKAIEFHKKLFVTPGVTGELAEFASDLVEHWASMCTIVHSFITN